MSKGILQVLVKWTRIKYRLHISKLEENFYFKEREIWWCSLGVNIGSEQDGKNEHFERPVLILRKFNKHIAWVLPQTTRDKEGSPFYQKTQHESKDYFIILSQIRTISSKRLLRKIRTLPKSEFSEIRKKVQKFLD